MSECPYCGSTYKSTHPPVHFSKRQRAVYDAVAAGGPGGITAKSLLDVVYGDEPPKSGWGVIRVNVFEINRKLKDHGQRIKGLRDVGYILIKDGEETDSAS